MTKLDGKINSYVEYDYEGILGVKIKMRRLTKDTPVKDKESWMWPKFKVRFTSPLPCRFRDMTPPFFYNYEIDYDDADSEDVLYIIKHAIDSGWAMDVVLKSLVLTRK